MHEEHDTMTAARPATDQGLLAVEIAPSRDSLAVLVVDQDRLTGECLANWLRGTPAVASVVHATGTDQAMRVIEDHTPAVVVVGPGAPSEVVHRIGETSKVPIVAIACGVHPQGPTPPGVTTLSRRSASADDLVETVLRVGGARRPEAGDAAQPIRRLSGREREIVQLLVHGASTQDIADQLFLSTHTVRNHVRNILGKLGAHTKLEAIVKATRLGLISIDQRST
jgi:DNA-binding NarL/FixJ family response regulator